MELGGVSRDLFEMALMSKYYHHYHYLLFLGAQLHGVDSCSILVVYHQHSLVMVDSFLPFLTHLCSLALPKQTVNRMMEERHDNLFQELTDYISNT